MLRSSVAGALKFSMKSCKFIKIRKVLINLFPFSFSDSFMDESIAKTNTFYGGLDPKIHQVFFTHGEMDPRRSLGPSQDINPHSPVVVMSCEL